MRNLLGGKGANLAEMARLKLPVPPGFTISTRVCNYFYDHGHKYPKGLTEGVAKSVARVEKALGRKFGDAKNPLLVSVRSGARVSMPGMMDTVLNLGLTDETVKGLAEISGNPRFAWDSYRRFCQMFGDVVLKLKPENKNDPDPFEEIIDHKKATRGVKQRHRPERRRFAGTGRRVPRADSLARRARHPAGSARATVDGDRRGVRLVAQRSRDHVPAHQQYPGRLGHRGHGAIDGVRQSRRRLRDRRRVHARSRHRRERNLRRVSAQRAGRGRRRGNPHRAADQPEGGARMGGARGNQRGGARAHYATLEESFPEVYKQFLQNLGAARKAFSRHAGHGIYDRAQSAVHAADAQRQAHGAGRGANRGGHGRREADRSQDRAQARRARTARAVSASAAGPVEQKTRHRARTAGVAGRGQRRSGVLGGRSGRRRGSRAQSDPGAAGDLAGRHPRDAGRRGNPHGARRHDESRGGGRARDGQVVRGRSLGAGNRLRRGHAVGQRRGDSSRRVHHARRIGGRSDRGAGADGRSRDAVVLQKISVVGGRGAQTGSARERRHSQRRENRARLWRRRNRAVPHRAHVLRSRANLGGARNDHGGERAAARARAGEDPADAARGFRRNPESDGRAAGHDPFARSAAARISAACGQRAARSRGQNRHHARASEAGARRACSR